MNVDEALASGIDREIRERRRLTLDDDPRSTAWTDRDVARRMTDAGHSIAHPAINLARKGKRRITTGEMFIFASVLGVTPAALLGPDPLVIGTTSHSAGEVVQWLQGRQPLPGTDRTAFLATLPQVQRSQPSSGFRALVGGVLDHYDTSVDLLQRQEALEALVRLGVDQMKNDRRLDRRHSRRRKGGK